MSIPTAARAGRTQTAAGSEGGAQHRRSRRRPLPRGGPRRHSCTAERGRPGGSLPAPVGGRSGWQCAPGSQSPLSSQALGGQRPPGLTRGTMGAGQTLRPSSPLKTENLRQARPSATAERAVGVSPRGAGSRAATPESPRPSASGRKTGGQDRTGARPGDPVAGGARGARGVSRTVVSPHEAIARARRRGRGRGRDLPASERELPRSPATHVQGTGPTASCSLCRA